MCVPRAARNFYFPLNSSILLTAIKKKNTYIHFYVMVIERR